MQYRIVFNISATLILAPFTDYRNTLRSNCKRPRAWVYSYTALKLLERKCATCHATRKRSLDSASRVLRNTPGELRHPRYPLKFLITGKPKYPRGVTEHPIFNCAETNQRLTANWEGECCGRARENKGHSTPVYCQADGACCYPLTALWLCCEIWIRQYW